MLYKKFKTKENYIKRKIAETDVLISIGGNIADFNGYIELNDSAVIIWDKLTNGADRMDLICALTQTFKISQEVATADVDEFIELLLEHGMIEEL